VKSSPQRAIRRRKGFDFLYMEHPDPVTYDEAAPNLETKARVISATGVRNSLPKVGRWLFSLAIASLGDETLVCAHFSADSQGPEYRVIPVLPWLPPIPWLAYVFGLALVACGLCLLGKETERLAALALGGLLFLSALMLDLPKYAAHIENKSLRTTLFEPLALAALAWLMPASSNCWVGLRAEPVICWRWLSLCSVSTG
jgi:hypothetical protein